MKGSRRWRRTGPVLLLAGVFALAGCGKTPPSVENQLQELEATFQTTGAPGSQPDPAVGYVEAALAAVKENDYAAGVIALQSAQQQDRLSVEQLQAVHGAMQALTASLVERAASGDASAQAALQAIERTRSQ